jgi:hypothetical protein
MSRHRKGSNDSLYRHLGLSILEPATTLHGMTTTPQPAHATSTRQSGVWEQQLEHQQQGLRHDTSQAPGMFYYLFFLCYLFFYISYCSLARDTSVSNFR